MKNSERFAAATTYADNAFATALGVSPDMVGFAMLQVDVPLADGKLAPLWKMGKVKQDKLVPMMVQDRQASVDALAAKYAGYVEHAAANNNNPSIGGDYEHDFNPTDLGVNLAKYYHENKLGIPTFLLGDDGEL